MFNDPSKLTVDHYSTSSTCSLIKSIHKSLFFYQKYHMMIFKINGMNSPLHSYMVCFLLLKHSINMIIICSSAIQNYRTQCSRQSELINTSNISIQSWQGIGWSSGLWGRMTDQPWGSMWLLAQLALSWLSLDMQSNHLSQLSKVVSMNIIIIPSKKS